MKGFKSTSTNPYTYTQSGVWKKGQYTFQAVVLSDSGYAFAFQRSDTTWQTVDLSWQVKEGSYSKIQWTFTLEVDAVAFRLIANTVTGETIVVQPMLEKGTNGSTPIAHEEDLRGMDGDNHEFIFTRNDTGIAPPTPLSTQEDDYIPIDDSVEPPVIWTDNPQGVTKELPFEFVSMREKKNGVWLDFSPPSLWAKWSEDGLSVNLLVEGHYNSHWEGTTKVVEIVGGVDVGGKEVVKVSAVFRKGEENVAATVSQSRGFQWYVNGVHLTAFDNQPFITLDETYGDGFADYVVLSYLVNSIREEERREIINISEGMDGKSVEFIFKLSPGELVVPTVPQTSDPNFQDDDYHGQGTANEWEDDPVSPTWIDTIAWVSERKKVNGVWGAFSQPSIWSRYVQDGEDGKDAKSLILSASSLTMKCNPDNTPQTGQTISIEAKLQNVSGTATFVATPYNDAGTALVAITLGGSGNTRTLTSSQWLSTFQKVVITATLSGLSDTVTITRLSDGGDGEPAKSIHLNPSAKAISITKGNIPVPASVTVIGTAVNTTIQYWYYSVDGATSFTGTPPTGVTRSGNQVTINSATATFKTLSIKARNSTDDVEDVVTITRGGGAPYVDETTNTWWTWNEELGIYTDTGYSPVGSDGAIPYPAGYYDNTKWYRREAGYAPYVQYEGALYLLIKDTPNAGIPTTNTEYWKAFNNWQAVFVDSLVAAFAKIGGAVFTGDTSDVSSSIKGRLISEKGIDGTTNYNTYTGDGGTWQPKLMLDFLNGKSKFTESEITGIIHALSGDIGGFDIANKRIGTIADEHSSTGNGLAIYDDFIKFSKRIADADGGSVPEDSYVWVGIGENVFPASSGSRGLARFENHEQQGYWGTQSQTYYTYSAYQAAGSPTPATFYYIVYDDMYGNTWHTYSSSTYYNDTYINNHYYPFIYGGYFQHIIADVPVWYPYSTNYGVIIDVKGAAENIALDLYSGSIAGLAIRTRQISSGTTLTRQDVYVSCYNTSTITVYLPANPQVGKIIFVHRVNEAGITVNGNGKTILWGSGSGISINTGGGEGKGDTGVYVYDGQYWQYNYLVRKPG